MSGWRKSSRSMANGSCVEISEDYRKSSRSMNNGNCAEVATGPAGILVRDTTDRDGLVLSLTAGAWRAFTGALRDGRVPS